MVLIMRRQFYHAGSYFIMPGILFGSVLRTLITLPALNSNAWSLFSLSKYEFVGIEMLLTLVIH